MSTPATDSSTDVLTVEAMAELLGCAAETVLDRIRDGTLPGVAYGRSPICTRAALLEAITRAALANLERRPKAEPQPKAPPPAPMASPAAGNGARSRRRTPPVLPPFPEGFASPQGAPK